MEIKNCGIILAAGFSGRMGKFKPLLNYKGKSFLRNVAEKLSLVCNKIVVVTGYKEDEIIKDLSLIENENLKQKITTVKNPEFEKGMFTSLQTGLSACENADWFFYSFVDQPDLPEEFYFEFVRQIEDGVNWIQPAYKGRKGHPILFDKLTARKILEAPKSMNLRVISGKKGLVKKIWGCDFPQILTDIDTPENYRALVRD